MELCDVLVQGWPCGCSQLSVTVTLVWFTDTELVQPWLSVETGVLGRNQLAAAG